MSKKTLKIYTMCHGYGGWTNQSRVYGLESKTLANVAAYSIKQAYYLINNNSWGEEGKAGIYEIVRNDKVYKGADDAGELFGSLHWNHGARVKPPKNPLGN